MRVAWANDQADQNLACPTAKNLVAAEIKRVIDSYRRQPSRRCDDLLIYCLGRWRGDVIPSSNSRCGGAGQ
ncbi:MAG: hypothetical protein R2867_42930 [Caldilineaceae bacterium]